MRVALVHDHLAQDGGAEQVFKALVEIFPDAPIYTLLYDQKYIDKYYRDRQIDASIIQRLPGGVKHYQWYMPFMPMAVEFFDLGNYDLVLSDSSSFAKGVITKPETLHIDYCHTPTRYLWSDTHEYINALKYNKYFKKIISLVLNYVRIWDRQAADRVDVFIANSLTCQKRITKYYRRESTIIYPNVDIEKFNISSEVGDYFLVGCRLVPYKRIDIVIDAFKKMPDKKLKVFGDGIDLSRLKNIAGEAENIELLGRVSDAERAKLFSQCQAFINPQVEDFGITVVESMASGRPVIAYSRGGALETVIPGKTGLFFSEQTAEAIKETVQNFNPNNFTPQFIREHAEKFSKERFKKEMKEFIGKEWEKFSASRK
ncbi:MAG: glycosyltransferase [Patescibacteria group bacterium]|nr:glycosyltransferase [Patescibacteria group bacterium]MDD4610875.1 glycosyltransferase [Patescibacteria group bacterium]